MYVINDIREECDYVIVVYGYVCYNFFESNFFGYIVFVFFFIVV